MIGSFFFILFLIHGASAAAIPPPPTWQTLSGNHPAIIARGGYSGLFPESSDFANQFALQTGVPGVILYCNLQLTKDGAPLCKSDLRLDNSTTISMVYPDGQKTYNVNGISLTGWFAVDYTYDELSQVFLTQSIFSRPSQFDGTMPIPVVDAVVGMKPPGFWLNVPYNSFFKEHNLDVVEYIASVSTTMEITFISSPEIDTLKAIGAKGIKSKLIFHFLGQDVVELSSNKTYGSLLTDLNLIKAFASGIVVPKGYIWPIGSDLYLGPPSTLVKDAHKLGLEVYASTFANDLPASYNYSYDPTAEYLQFVDNGDFSVDGVITDFPSTASEAIACFAHNKNAPSKKNNALIITHNGASGVFAGCTDLAYKKAVEDGADVIDCSVQMSKDGIPFCLNSADLMPDTTAVSTFMPRLSTVPEIQKNGGIFSFDLTWSEIQGLKPQLVSPNSQSGLLRNPAAKNQGKFMSLPDFLDFAKTSTVPGILINIENAAYLASKKSLSIVDVVSSALRNSSFDKSSTKQVYIQSGDTSVLSAFKNNASYKRVLMIEEVISDAPKQSVDEIKKFADSVVIHRSSVFNTRDSFLSSATSVVNEMHAANISVYVSVLRNEFLMVAFDFFSDPVAEIVNYVSGIGVDGIVTEFPATANTYLRSPCADPQAKLPYTILPVQPGGLLQVIPPEAVSPAEAPAPVLDPGSVIDPPLPPVVEPSAKSPDAAPAEDSKSSGQPPANAVNAVLCLSMALISLMRLNHQ